MKIPSIGKSFTIERKVKAPMEAQITPNTPEILAVVRQIEEHPEIVLSRRELIRYVLASPGKRAEEVQSLLHLDKLEKVRLGLQRIANGYKKQLAPYDTAVVAAKANLLRALEIIEFKKENILVSVNAQRKILNLTVLKNITETTTFKDGMTVPVSKGKTVQPLTIPKIQADADIKAARKALADITGDANTSKIKDILDVLNALNNDPLLLNSLQQEKFYSIGMGLVLSGSCPFCDTIWNPTELKIHVQDKINQLKEISRKRKTAESKIHPLIVSLRNVQSAINVLLPHMRLVKPPMDVSPVVNYVADCGSSIELATAFLPLAQTMFRY